MEFKKAKRDISREGYPPEKYFVDQFNVTAEQYHQFKELLEKNAGETDIDAFLKKNLAILSNALRFFNTGHHGTWIIPQQEIKPPTDTPGLKPDYILGGRSSDGFQWWVIDLKGSNKSIFSESQYRTRFSLETNKGVFQVLQYMDYCAEMQAYLREGLSLTEFREPCGLLIIGKEKELNENPLRRKLKSAWNRISSEKLMVRTYDALLREVEAKLEGKKMIESMRDGTYYQ